MKKTLSILVAAVMILSLFAGCGAVDKGKNDSDAAKTEHAEYTVYNTTGAKLTELYLYPADSNDKGENLAASGIADGETIVITRDATEEEASKLTYVLEFTAEGMDTQKFETLHFEVAPISLKSVDAAAGATPISFSAPEG